MNALWKGLLLAALQVALVCSLGAKLLYDRATRPRVWFQVATYDPDLPIRGRYLVFSLQLPAEGFKIRDNPQPYATSPYVPVRCDLAMRNGVLTAVGNEDGEFWVNVRDVNHQPVAIVNTQTPFFVPEHAIVPSPRADQIELWIEATLPRKGPPRPIRLATKKDGVITPLPLD
jgi:hypothetical protein